MKEGKVSDAKDGRKELERQRSYSIVKPAVEEMHEEKDEAEELDVDDEHEEETTPCPVRYKVCLFPEPAKLRRDSSGSTNLEEKVRGWTEDGSRAGSEAPTNSQRSLSCESLERLESLPSSPSKDETTPVAPRPGSFLEKVTITQDDPLGALSAQSCTPEMSTPREKGPSHCEPLAQRSQSLSDVLGEPFSPSNPLRTPNQGSQSASLVMQRSSTMPLNNELSSTPSTPGSLAGSTYSMAGIKSLSSSKAARLGLSRGKGLLSSAWTSLSP